MKEFIKLAALPVFAAVEIYFLESTGYVNRIDPTSACYLGAPAVVAWIYFMNWMEGYPIWNGK